MYRLSVHHGAVERVALWFVAAVGPHQRCAVAEEVQIDGFGQVLEQQFDIVAVRALVPGGRSSGARKILPSPAFGAPFCVQYSRRRSQIDSDADTVVAVDVRRLVAN